MAHRGGVAQWVAGRPARSFFTPADVPGSTSAVESSLSRLAGADGPIQRVRQGLYWKKPPATRFGTARPDPIEAAFVVAGPGAGLAAVSAANAVGLSTQVARQPTVAVVGRPPKGLVGVRFTSRANPQRIHLSQFEITALEALRDFPVHSEMSWPEARDRIIQLAADGRIDLGKLATVAAGERRAGLAKRIAELTGRSTVILNLHCAILSSGCDIYEGGQAVREAASGDIDPDGEQPHPDRTEDLQGPVAEHDLLGRPAPAGVEQQGVAEDGHDEGDDRQLEQHRAGGRLGLLEGPQAVGGDGHP